MSSVNEEKLPLSPGAPITPIQQMISSCTGACLTSLLMTPLDVVKIRLQAQAKPSSFTKGHCFIYCNGLMDHLCPCVNGLTPSSQWYKRSGQFNGTFDAMIKIARSEGITSLWSGLPPTLVMAVPATVVYFASYEQMKSLLGYNIDSLGNWWKPMVAGATARVTTLVEIIPEMFRNILINAAKNVPLSNDTVVWAASLISPIEMVRTKMQSEHFTYSQIWNGLRDTVKKNGVLSLWNALGPTLLRDVPFSAMYWATFEAMKSYVLITDGRDTLNFFENFAAGAFAGSIVAVLTLPFDVIKTRRQIELGEVLTGKKKGPTSTWKIIANIYSTEGYKALYTGLPPRLIKVAPSCAIMISTYEFFKQLFADRNRTLSAEMGGNESFAFISQNQSLTQGFLPSPELTAAAEQLPKSIS